MLYVAEWILSCRKYYSMDNIWQYTNVRNDRDFIAEKTEENKINDVQLLLV